MGNCQAIDAASLVIQHPNGRLERFYGPVPANTVMKSNPGHYIVLMITSEKNAENGVRVTRVKLIKSTDILVLGQTYRLIESQEVMKGLWEKKYAKMKKKELESNEKARSIKERTSELEVNQAERRERNQQRITPSASARAKQWRPSLQSISEAGISQPPKVTEETESLKGMK